MSDKLQQAFLAVRRVRAAAPLKPQAGGARSIGIGAPSAAFARRLR